jgi:anaerobic ribonucleoside-triphosphate reductase
MTYQEANALVDDFSFVYKGKSISKEALIECREIIHKALEKQIARKPTAHKVDVPKIKVGNGFFGKGTTVYRCPCCNELISKICDCCYNCGQAINWSVKK